MPAPLDYAPAPLRRQIGLFGAVMLGLGSILGTGVFVGLPMAAALAGPWVLVAIVLAGGLALCNALSSAQLAAANPVAGGTYEYGYRLLSPAWGFTAGWTFLLAKSASAATAALAAVDLVQRWTPRRVRRGLIDVLDVPPSPSFADTLEDLARLTSTRSICVVLVVVFLTLLGLRRTSVANGVLVCITLLGLMTFCVLEFYWLMPFTAHGQSRVFDIIAETIPFRWDHLATATALSFVAFTGYGRLATLGEEVHRPDVTISKAITWSLGIAVIVYVAVALVVTSLLAKLIFGGEACEGLTLQDYARGLLPGSDAWQNALLRALPHILGAAALTAMLGVLLNLVLGLSRVWLAMGRRGDMPRVLARVSERSGTPVPATLIAGMVIAAFVLVGDVRLTWSFSAFSVLIYYAITNLACLRLPPADRRYPRSLAWVGLVSCAGLAWFVEPRVWIVGVGLVVVGLIWHRLRATARRSVALPPVLGREDSAT